MACELRLGGLKDRTVKVTFNSSCTPSECVLKVNVHIFDCCRQRNSLLITFPVLARRQNLLEKRKKSLTVSDGLQWRVQTGCVVLIETQTAP